MLAFWRDVFVIYYLWLVVVVVIIAVVGVGMVRYRACLYDMRVEGGGVAYLCRMDRVCCCSF
jgi:hypothetical protein